MFERNTNNSWVAGVAAGLADKHNTNVVLIRMLFVVGFFLFGIGLAVYAWYWGRNPETNTTIRMDFST
jgi:phage shock protein PspC (stress-responsive transcriptional regulator)